MHVLQGKQYVSKYNWYKPYKSGIETKKLDNTPFGRKASRSNALQIQSNVTFKNSPFSA